MHSTLVYAVALFVIFISPTFAQVETTTRFRIPTRTGGNKTCTTRNNEEGICVQKSSCNNAHEIEIGGRISDSELRAGDTCNLLAGEWCCTFKKNNNEVGRGGGTTIQPVPTGGGSGSKQPDTTPGTPRTGRNCLTSDGKDCPWFVKLYRQGQDYPYCLGAMIGSNAILTTATCVLQGNNLLVWANVPSSAKPDANYTILSTLSHPKYNSGTRLNDLALLITASNIDWGTGGPKGACIDPTMSLSGECVAANINEYNDLDMASLFVTQGSCSTGGNVRDAMCGTGLVLDLVDGSPIMCEKNNVYVLSGITKTSFPLDTTKALLGNLDYSWLTENLKTRAGLKDTDYSFKLNYN